MNTIEIIEKIKQDGALKQIFLGVFPADKAPPINVFPAALVLNLDKSSMPGSHWVAIYFTKSGKCEFFDSYGRKPCGLILRYLSDNCSKYTYNNICVQSLWTTYCGHLCLYFLIWRCRGISFKTIIRYLLDDSFAAGFINSL
jgi:hypothetical protein